MPICDDAVQDIKTESKDLIFVDMDSGYWQLAAEEEARERLAFFTPYGKRQ